MYVLLAVANVSAGVNTRASAEHNKDTEVVRGDQEKSVVSYRTLSWSELLPADDLDAMMNPPDYLGDIAEGSAADQLGGQAEGAIAGASNSRYQQALSSERVVESLNSQWVRLPAFIVPLEFDDDYRITEFFLVPYFGACIHMPPPPPNQIVYATYPEGFELDALYDPKWVSGLLQTTLTEGDTATAAYAMTVNSISEYTP